MTTAPTYSEIYRLTVADWLDLADDSRIVEIIDGEIFMAPSPAVRHQSLAREFTVRLYRHVVEGGRGTLFFAPTGLKLRDDVVLEPDIFVVLEENRGMIRELYVEAADLVVEILSPGTAGRDVGVKKQRYEEAAVAEYWIVDPVARSVQVFALESGTYGDPSVYAAADVLKSPLLPGLSIELSTLWDRQ